MIYQGPFLFCSIIVSFLPIFTNGCFGGGRHYTSWETSYCRNNVEYCLSKACEVVAQHTPPGCSDWRIEQQVRRRLETCDDLNVCFKSPLSIQCTKTISDCPMYHMCRDGSCWAEKLNNFYCNYKSDCIHSVYDCINHQCEIVPFGANPAPISSNYFDLTPPLYPIIYPRPEASLVFYNTYNPAPSSSNNYYDRYSSSNNYYSSGSSSNDRPVPNGNCRLSDECSVDSMCRNGQCWPKVVQNSYCTGDWQCENNLYKCRDNKCRILGEIINVSSGNKGKFLSSNQIQWAG